MTHKNLDEHKIYQKEYARKPEVKKRRKEQYLKVRKTEKFRAYRNAVGKKYNKKNPDVALLVSARRRAKNANLPCSITREDIKIGTHCPILGIEYYSGGKQTSPSLDKIIPEKGYVKGNIAVISLRANRLKQDSSIDEIRAILKYMEENLKEIS